MSALDRIEVTTKSAKVWRLKETEGSPEVTLHSDGRIHVWCSFMSRPNFASADLRAFGDLCHLVADAADTQGAEIS